MAFQVAKTANFLKLCISKTGTINCGCLQLDEIAHKLSHLKDSEVKEVVTLTVDATIAEFKNRGFEPVLNNMCLNTRRFERGIEEFRRRR